MNVSCACWTRLDVLLVGVGLHTPQGGHNLLVSHMLQEGSHRWRLQSLPALKSSDTTSASGIASGLGMAPELVLLQIPGQNEPRRRQSRDIPSGRTSINGWLVSLCIDLLLEIRGVLNGGLMGTLQFNRRLLNLSTIQRLWLQEEGFCRDH